jgi:hypothetical protein
MTTDTQSEKQGSTPSAQPAASRKRRLTRTLPTDRIAFAKQQSILGAYAVAYEKFGSKPVSNDEVGTLVNMAGATISQATAFFVDTGLIIKAEAGKYQPSEALLDYDRSKSFSPEKAWLKLAPSLKTSWFGQEIISRLRLRSTMTEDDAIHALADASSAEHVHRDQLRMIIDYMSLTGLVAREAGNLRLGTQAINGETAPETTTPTTTSTTQQPPPPAAPPGTETYTLTLDPNKGRKVVVQAPPMVNAKELDRIQKWLAVQLIVEGAEPQ